MKRSATIVAALLLVLAAPAVRADDQDEQSDQTKKTLFGIYGGAAELLYAEPDESTNKRFSDLHKTHFDGAGTFHARQVVVRGRGSFGDGDGFEGRIALELTHFAATARRSYDQGELGLTHRFAGADIAIGTSYLATTWLVPYFELAVLFPSFVNEVVLSSAAGRAEYDSDTITTSLRLGGALGADFQVHGPWLLKLHLSDWPEGSGKATGLHVGAGYAF